MVHLNLPQPCGLVWQSISLHISQITSKYENILTWTVAQHVIMYLSITMCVIYMGEKNCMLWYANQYHNSRTK